MACYQQCVEQIFANFHEEMILAMAPRTIVTLDKNAKYLFFNFQFLIFGTYHMHSYSASRTIRINRFESCMVLEIPVACDSVQIQRERPRQFQTDGAARSRIGGARIFVCGSARMLRSGEFQRRKNWAIDRMNEVLPTGHRSNSKERDQR